MEVVVASIILAITMVGIVNLFVSGARYVQHSRARMTGGEFGRYFLDPLQEQVRQDEWGTNCLSNPAGCQQTLTKSIDNLNYTATYKVDAGPTFDGPSDTRRVQIDLNWNETGP